jgi:dolichol-phosphate mannosyltransferase
VSSFSQSAATKVTVVVPTYNESGNIVELCRRLLVACGSQFDLVICVADDNSPDGTADLAAAVDPRVHVLRRTTDRGYGRAVNAGIKFGLSRDSNFIVSMDADFSHQPELVPALIAEAQRQPLADLVIGSRYADGDAAVEDWPWSRLLLSKCASAYIRWMLGVDVKDPTSGFRCWRGTFVKTIPLDQIRASGYAYIYETLYYGRNATVREVRNLYVGRKHGESKMTLGIVWEGLKIPFLLRLRGR